MSTNFSARGIEHLSKLDRTTTFNFKIFRALSFNDDSQFVLHFHRINEIKPSFTILFAVLCPFWWDARKILNDHRGLRTFIFSPIYYLWPFFHVYEPDRIETSVFFRVDSRQRSRRFWFTRFHESRQSQECKHTHFHPSKTRLYSVTIWQQAGTTRYINREMGIENIGINRRIEKWERMDRMVSRFQSFKAIVILGQFHQLESRQNILVARGNDLKRVPTFANIFRHLESIWSRLNDNDPVDL